MLFQMINVNQYINFKTNYNNMEYIHIKTNKIRIYLNKQW